MITQGLFQVPFNEFVDMAAPGASPVEAFQVGLPRSTRIFNNIPGNQRQGFLRDKLGYPEILIATNGIPIASGKPYLSRKLPDKCNDWIVFNTTVSNSFLWATDCLEMRGVGGGLAGAGWPPGRAGNYGQNVPNDGAAYPFVQCTIQYTAPMWDYVSDAEMLTALNINGVHGPSVDASGNPDESTWVRYCTKLAAPKSQYLQLKFQGNNPLGYAAGDNIGKALLATPGKIISTMDVCVIWQEVPSRAVPMMLYNPDLLQGNNFVNAGSKGAIDVMVGDVNHNTFNGFDAGTLLLLAATIRPRRSQFGYRVFDIEYRFEYNPHGHNNVLGILQAARLVPPKPLILGFVEANTYSAPGAPGGPKPIAMSYPVGAPTPFVLGQIVRFDTAGNGCVLDLDYTITVLGPGGIIDDVNDPLGNPFIPPITGRVIPRGVHIYEANDFRRLFRVPGQV